MALLACQYDAGPGPLPEPCESDLECSPGHACLLPDWSTSTPQGGPITNLNFAATVLDDDAGSSVSDDDAGVEPPAMPLPDSNAGFFPPSAGVCSGLCDQRLCPERTECLSPTGECTEVDCGAFVRCSAASSALYCDARAHSCHRTNGKCGWIGQENYPCPRSPRWVRGDLEVECLTKRGESAGDCTFTIERPKTRGIDTDAARRLEIRAPEYGAVLEDEGELSFAVDGSREVLFVLVLRGLPEPSGVDVSQRLVWGAALARATASETRHVFWSEGHDISEGEWLSGPASATPRNEDLFAFAVGVDNGNVVAATDELLLFRVGRGWAIPDVTDCSDVAINEPASGAAAVEGCAHPTQVMGCVAGTCRRLCLSSLDCGEQQECVIHETLGTRYCR